MVAISHNNMAGTAILTCRSNSHPFTERKLILENTPNKNAALKIGRSIARTKVAPSNGIFDCKVLSRNHALIWYYNGKFYLQDTKSSNGTFVNNQRLSKTNEESPPHELCSGDVVQFGVDVIETNRNTPVTHGCIIATIKLFLPDGKEAKASPSSMLISSMPLEELYQLNTFIQEALQRENILENKLSKLQNIIIDLKKAADVSWTALIQEDRLLSRVEFLESQLAAYSKSFTDDKLRDEIKLLHKDKSMYENQLKEVMKKMLAEKVEVMQKCQDTERKLMNVENECSNLQEMIDINRGELEEVIKKYQDQVNKNKEFECTINQLLNSNQEKSNTLEKLQYETLQAQKQLDAFTLKDNLMHDKLKTYYLNFHMIKEKMTNIKNELGSETKVDQNVLVKYFDDVHEIMTQFDEYFLRFSESDSSGLNSIEDIEKVTNDLKEQLHTAQDEQMSLQEIVNRNEVQLTYLEQSKYLHVDKIAGLELQLEKLKQNYNSELNFENDKLGKAYNCDSMLISDEKTVGGNQKDVNIVDVNNQYNSEKDFLCINKEIEESSRKIEDINNEISKCTNEVVDAKNCLVKNEKWVINLQEQFSLLEKSKETLLISLKLNSAESKNNASLQGQLNEALDKIKKFKEEHTKMTQEIESLKEKLKHSEDNEDKLTDEYERMKSVLKSYQNVLPSIVQSKSSNNNDNTLEESQLSVEQEITQDSVSTIRSEPIDETEPSSTISSKVSEQTTIDTTDCDGNETNQDVIETEDNSISLSMLQSLHLHPRPSPTISSTTLVNEPLDQGDSSPIDSPESDPPTIPNDDDTDDSSSEMTDSSTLIRIRKPKLTVVPSGDNAVKLHMSASCQTLTEFQICTIESHKLHEESFLYQVTHYFNNVDELSPLSLLGIIVMFLGILTPIMYSFENILSHITATYDPQ
uniref:Sarcolemmal membrane-associated protein n=2 Tax=Cacopsylla melanoneura TaxID=428564 RepID=A0A8D8YRV3_9HEMI